MGANPAARGDPEAFRASDPLIHCVFLVTPWPLGVGVGGADDHLIFQHNDFFRLQVAGPSVVVKKGAGTDESAPAEAPAPVVPQPPTPLTPLYKNLLQPLTRTGPQSHPSPAQCVRAIEIVISFVFLVKDNPHWLRSLPLRIYLSQVL